MSNTMTKKQMERLVEGGFEKYEPGDPKDHIPVDQWGKDHWSTLAYVETRIVDHGGVIDNQHMRTNARLHRSLLGQAQGDHGMTEEDYPTRLKSGKQQPKHDDWSCLEDMAATGLVDVYICEDMGLRKRQMFGYAKALVFLTEEGRRIANALREHKGNGGNFAGFEPPDA